ncbi:MAG: cyanophycin synthetase family protein [Raoultibacter sp.]|jgi:hypothetical protein
MHTTNAQSPACAIEQLRVKQDRIVCLLQIDNEAHRYTSPELIRGLSSDFPGLGKHTCKNAYGPTFAAVMENTSIPHLLEHLVIDLQAAQCRQSAEIFVGTSEWIDEQAGRACIEVSFTDDLNALRAFRDAISILNKAVISYVNR